MIFLKKKLSITWSVGINKASKPFKKFPDIDTSDFKASSKFFNSLNWL